MNATVDLHTSDVPRPEQRNYKWYLKSFCVLQDNDERNKTVFQSTKPDLQDQDQNQDHHVHDQDQEQDKPKTDFVGLRPVLS